VPARFRRTFVGSIVIAGVFAAAGCSSDPIEPRSSSSPTEQPGPTSSESLVTTQPPGPTTTLRTVSIDYIVESGDSLAKISRDFGVGVGELMAANGITDPNRVLVGQKLIIPPPVPTTRPAPTTTTAPPSTQRATTQPA
jgi:LysM repeat protein